METSDINPTHWRVDTLLACGSNTIHQLALAAAGTLTAYRLVLGRCLLALQQSKAYKEHGCSGAVHYATRILGLDAGEARTLRRVAVRLRELPALTEAAEQGTIAWGMLREIVRKATPETEHYWLELARSSTYKEIEFLVRHTPKGSIPGEVSQESSGCSSELRCALSPEVFQLLEQALRLRSQECGQVVSTAELLEWVLAGYLEQRDPEKALREAGKDLAAERARQHPLVWQARELAMDMGLLGPARVATEEEEPALEESLARAIGLPYQAELSSLDLRPAQATKSPAEQPVPMRDDMSLEVAVGSRSPGDVLTRVLTEGSNVLNGES